MNLINILVQGVLLGGYYAMLAVGLSFMVSVMRIINLAHGSLAILSAFVLLVLATNWGINPFLGLVIALPTMAVVGWLLQRTILERSARAGELVAVLSTFGLSIVIDNLLFEFFGANTRSLAPFVGSLTYDSWAVTGDLYVGKLAVLTFVVALALLGGLQLFLTHTYLGRAIRATSEDPSTAELVGVNSRAINAAAASITLVTVAIAGMFLAMRATFEPYAGSLQLIFAFEAAVIGGAGSLWGTLIGGIVLALAQTIGAQFHPQGFLIAGHAVFLFILFTRRFWTVQSLKLLAGSLLKWRAA
jgi:branched-chain amino acid transport system permease protein